MLHCDPEQEPPIRGPPRIEVGKDPPSKIESGPRVGLPPSRAAAGLVEVGCERLLDPAQHPGVTGNHAQFAVVVEGVGGEVRRPEEHRGAVDDDRFGVNVVAGGGAVGVTLPPAEVTLFSALS